MKGKSKEHEPQDDEKGRVIPLFGKDEMNLIEFPFGPITPNGAKTLEVEHEVFDKTLGRTVTRKLVLTGADAFGLPRPIDDQVLVGMKALTFESRNGSQEVRFSRYELCRAIGWEPDGRAYQRLEESLDRIAGTTLKFKDAWWDKGEMEWKSRTFHLIETVSLCSRDELDRKRLKSGAAQQKLCSFVWSDVVWKSLQDGFIKTLDMRMFRRIAKGGRRDVPLRLFRVLDKRFFFGNRACFELERLCIGTLGLSPSYTPFEMFRVLERAAKWLIDCEFISEMIFEGDRLTRESKVVFIKAAQSRRIGRAVPKLAQRELPEPVEELDHKAWLKDYDESALDAWEKRALEEAFGSELERRLIISERSDGKSILGSGRIRTDYLRRFVELQSSVENPPKLAV